MNKENPDIFTRILAGGTILMDDPEISKMWDVVNGMLKLSPVFLFLRNERNYALRRGRNKDGFSSLINKGRHPGF